LDGTSTAKHQHSAYPRRKFPAEQAIWLVIGLALFHNLPLWQVVDQLVLCLRDQPLLASSASVQARQRLGYEPLQQLFHLQLKVLG